jgi:hypothetical protein
MPGAGKVRVEFSRTALVYEFCRPLNILSGEALMERYESKGEIIDSQIFAKRGPFDTSGICRLPRAHETRIR